MLSKVCDEIIYPLPIAPLKFRNWQVISSTLVNGCNYLSMSELKLIYRGPGVYHVSYAFLEWPFTKETGLILSTPRVEWITGLKAIQTCIHISKLLTLYARFDAMRTEQTILVIVKIGFERIYFLRNYVIHYRYLSDLPHWHRDNRKIAFGQVCVYPQEHG